MLKKPFLSLRVNVSFESKSVLQLDNSNIHGPVSAVDSYSAEKNRVIKNVKNYMRQK
jgi:hypothetical protein